MVQRLSSGMRCLHVAPTLCPAADTAQLASNSCSRDVHPACGTYPAAQPGWNCSKADPSCQKPEAADGKEGEGKAHKYRKPKEQKPLPPGESKTT